LPKAAILLDLEVATLVKDDLMPGFLEHLGFLLENDVFAPGLLIGVMNEEYFQRKLSPLPLASGLTGGKLNSGRYIRSHPLLTNAT
jgi:hypothetical protein